MSSSSGNAFAYPWQYSFPPFFTLQPNDETRCAQLNAWRSLILSYCESHRIYVLDVQNAVNEPIFKNTAINRQLSNDALKAILEHMRQNGNMEWIDKACTKCYVYWKTPQEWSQLIYNWVTEKSLANTVCTFYEMVSGDTTQNYPFHSLNETILVKALRCLEKEGKAAIMDFDGNKGVKFF